MILFVTKDCPDCRELKRRLTAAGVDLSAVPGLHVVDIETSEGADLADMYGIGALPTLRVAAGNELVNELMAHYFHELHEIVERLTTETRRARSLPAEAGTEGEGVSDH